MTTLDGAVTHQTAATRFGRGAPAGDAARDAQYFLFQYPGEVARDVNAFLSE